jgi:hypothetical protein
MFRNSQRSTGCDAGSVETPTMVATCDDADDVDPTVTSLAFPFGDWAAVVRRLRLALFAGLALCLVSCGQRDLETAQPTSNAADASIASRDAQQAGQGTSGTDLGHLQLREFRPDLQQEFELIDPQKDGWETERFSDLVSIELRKLKQMIAGEKNDLPALDKTFQCTALRPNSPSEVFRDRTMVIRRGIPQRQELRRGPEGLRAAIREAIAALPAQALIDSEAKIIEVQLDGAGGTTRVRVQINARGDTQTMQQTAEWLCQWKRDTDTQIALRSIEVVSYEEASILEGTSPALFADWTEAIVGHDSAFRNQLVHGIDYWRERLDWRFGADIVGAHGLAVGDVNGDGLEDLFVCETGGLPNRLFVQQADGTSVDQSGPAGVDYIEPTHSALLIDLDNDGDQDLVMSSGRFALLLENDGKGRFEQRYIHQTNSVARSMAAADYDLDGNLDIYVCGYFSRETGADQVGLGRPLPYHDANNGARNYLLKNEGEWRFSDVTDAVGLDENNRRFSYAAAWSDYDNDGDADLYVANDFGRNNLYRNEAGHFTDVAAEAGVEDISAGMSACWGDYNRDGRMDVYIGNMFSSAGNRIAYQRKFNSAADETARQQFQRHARGNSLFENAGDGTFRDVTMTAGVNMGRWAWSSNFADINNDGWEDIIIANGMVTSATDPNDL